MDVKYTKAQQCLIVEIPDHAYSDGVLPADRLTVWRKRAIKENCTSFSVFVIPDPLLPLCGFDRRTRVHSETVGLPDEQYSVNILYSAEIPADKWFHAGEAEKLALLRKVADDLAKRGHKMPGRFEIFYRNSRGGKEYLREGRV